MIDVRRMLDLLGVDYRDRGGGELWGICPFPWHGDAKPSWSIADKPGDDRHGSHYCFGCDRGGGPVDLVQWSYGFALRSSALEWIEKHELDLDDDPLLEVSVEIGATAAGVFELPPGVVLVPMAAWPTPARRYARARGITDAQVDRWGMGHAIWGDLRGRIVFPVRAEDGRLASYSARTFLDSNLRYRTPSTEEHPDLGVPFGAEHWPPPAERDVVVVTEGVVNALAAERAGAPNIAALDGSHLYAGAVARVASFRRVVIATDPDAAGDRIAGELQAMARWAEVERIAIPAGEDAQSLGDERLAGLLNESLYRDRRDVQARPRRGSGGAGGSAPEVSRQYCPRRSRARRSPPSPVQVDLSRGTVARRRRSEGGGRTAGGSGSVAAGSRGSEER